MKTLNLLFGSAVILFFGLAASTNLSSCKKKEIFVEVIKRDTIVVVDTFCHDLKDSLIAWYKFTNGSLVDSSGKGNHITFNNATPTTDRFGKPNNAYLFNGTSNFMSVPNSTSLNPQNAISMMAIIQVKGFYTGPCHANNIFSKGWNDFVNGFYCLRFTDLATNCNDPVNVNQERFYTTYGDLTAGRAGAGSTTNFIQKDKWINVIYTYGGGVSKLYVDGLLIDTRTGQNPIMTDNNLPLTIGKHGDPGFPYWFNGIIDEIRLYNKTLCDGDVKNLNKLKN
jgi:hypothetical protein